DSNLPEFLKQWPTIEEEPEVTTQPAIEADPPQPTSAPVKKTASTKVATKYEKPEKAAKQAKVEKQPAKPTTLKVPIIPTNWTAPALEELRPRLEVISFRACYPRASMYAIGSKAKNDAEWRQRYQAAETDAMEKGFSFYTLLQALSQAKNVEEGRKMLYGQLGQIESVGSKGANIALTAIIKNLELMGLIKKNKFMIDQVNLQLVETMEEGHKAWMKALGLN
ncbi:MAG: hypothetical protein AAB647_02370, partial [Patescibacteria group bacterium]